MNHKQLDLVARVSGLINKGQSVSVVGGTSVVRRELLTALVEAKGGVGQTAVFLHIPCAQLEQLSPHAVLAFLANKLAPFVAVDQRAMKAALNRLQTAPSYLHFDGLIRQFDRAGTAVYLLLDEFAHLSQNPQLDIHFFNALRATASRYPLVFVTTSAQPLIELTYLGRNDDILSSPFFNIFATVNCK